jgi:hypothetical protein
MSGASTINLSLGLLTVTGNATVGGASTITINQAALTVVGLFLLNSPTSAGTALLDVEGGCLQLCRGNDSYRDDCAGGVGLPSCGSARSREPGGRRRHGLRECADKLYGCGDADAGGGHQHRQYQQLYCREWAG